MEAVSQLMRQRADLIERAVEVGKDAAFLHALHFHAESSTALAIALFSIDPVVVEGAFGKCRKVWRELPEVCHDEIARFFKGIDFVSLAHGSKDVPPGKYL